MYCTLDPVFFFKIVGTLIALFDFFEHVTIRI